MSASPDGFHVARSSGPNQALAQGAGAPRFRLAPAHMDRGGEDSETARAAFRNALMTWTNEGGAR